MFEVSPGNPHDEDNDFFACYLWELDKGDLMAIRSNHYLNYEAAVEAQKRHGISVESVFCEFSPDFFIGRPPEKPNLTITLSELGEYWYANGKPRPDKGQHINEVV